jgi:2-methylcitrate dehydratase PrpD
MRGTSFKPYPLCNLYRPHMWMLQRMMDREHVVPEEITYVSLRTNAITSANFDPRVPTDPTDETALHMSPEYAVALAAYRVPPGPEWVHPRYLDDERIRSFMRKVHAEANPTAREIHYQPYAQPITPELLTRLDATIEVQTRGGTFSETVHAAKGDEWGSSGEPLTTEEVTQKFLVCASKALDEKRAQRTVEAVLELEHIDNVGPVMELTRTDSHSNR